MLPPPFQKDTCHACHSSGLPDYYAAHFPLTPLPPTARGHARAGSSASKAPMRVRRHAWGAPPRHAAHACAVCRGWGVRCHARIDEREHSRHISRLKRAAKDAESFLLPLSFHSTAAMCSRSLVVCAGMGWGSHMFISFFFSCPPPHHHPGSAGAFFRNPPPSSHIALLKPAAGR